MVPYALPWRNDPLNTGQRRHRYARGGNRTKKELRHCVATATQNTTPSYVLSLPLNYRAPSYSKPYRTNRHRPQCGEAVETCVAPLFISVIPVPPLWRFPLAKPRSISLAPYHTCCNTPIRIPIPYSNAHALTALSSSFFYGLIYHTSDIPPYAAKLSQNGTHNILTDTLDTRT